ncbi:MAG: hypothetical protein PHW62_02515 [Candidatus Ratteibacteria bacterium]|nr:hypothetical protein [Candidatus Ratteibacteria bacterium]
MRIETTKLPKKRIPFRKAYKKVAKNLNHMMMFEQNPYYNIKRKRYQGATGNLALHEARKQLEIYRNLVRQEKEKLRETKLRLLK